MATDFQPKLISTDGPIRRFVHKVSEKMDEKRDRLFFYGKMGVLTLTAIPVITYFAKTSASDPFPPETIIKDDKHELVQGGGSMLVFQGGPKFDYSKKDKTNVVIPNIDQNLQTDMQGKTLIQKVPTQQVETEMAFSQAGFILPGKVGSVIEYIILGSIALSIVKGLVKRTGFYTRAQASYHEALASQYGQMMDQAFISNSYLKDQLDAQFTDLIAHNPKYKGRTLESLRDELWVRTAKKLNTYTLRDWTELEKLANALSTDINQLSAAAEKFGINKSSLSIDATLDYEKLVTAITEDIETKGSKFVEKWRELSGNKSLMAIYRKSYLAALKELNIPQAHIDEIMNAEAMRFAQEQVSSFRDVVFSGPIARKFGAMGNWVAGKSLTVARTFRNLFGPAVSIEDLAIELIVNDPDFVNRLAANARIQNWLQNHPRYGSPRPYTNEDIALMIKEFPEVRGDMQANPAIWGEVTGIARDGQFWRIWGRAIKRAGVTAGVIGLGVAAYLLLDLAFSPSKGATFTDNKNPNEQTQTTKLTREQVAKDPPIGQFAGTTTFYSADGWKDTGDKLDNFYSFKKDGQTLFNLEGTVQLNANDPTIMAQSVGIIPKVAGVPATGLADLPGGIVKQDKSTGKYQLFMGYYGFSETGPLNDKAGHEINLDPCRVKITLSNVNLTSRTYDMKFEKVNDDGTKTPLWDGYSLAIGASAVEAMLANMADKTFDYVGSNSTFRFTPPK